MAHSAKLPLQILNRSGRRNAEIEKTVWLSKTKGNKGRNWLLRTINEGYMEKGKKIYVFIDLEKAFD